MTIDISEKQFGAILILQFVIIITFSGGFVTLTTPDSISTSDLKVAVVLVAFSDHTPEVSPIAIEKLVFQNSSHLMSEISYGRIGITGDVFGWFRISSNSTSYGHYDEHSLVVDAIRQTDALIDFSQYNRLVIIHSDSSWQKMGKNESYPSTSYLPYLMPTNDFRTFPGVVVASYLDSYSAFTHELLHSIGAVDLYNRARLHDEPFRSNDTYIGDKCLMGNGDDQLCLFQKLKIGFVDEHDIVDIGNQSIELEIIGMSEESLGHRGARFYRQNDSCYYLIEARTATGIEEGLPSGVLVTLINESNEPGYGLVDLAQYGSHIQNALLQVGQNFIDSENDFAVQVMCRTERGFNISFQRDIDYDLSPFDVNMNWTGSNMS